METIKETKKVKGSSPEQWLGELRQAARTRFGTVGFPVKDSETWKQVNLAPLVAQENSLVKEPSGRPARSQAEKYFLEEPQAVRLVFWNGKFSKELSNIPRLPKGVIAENLGDALQSHPELLRRYLAKGIEKEGDGFAALNAANFQDGVLIYLPEGVRLASPIQVLWLVAGDPAEKAANFYPRLLAILEKRAGAELVIQSVGLGNAPYLTNAVAEFYLAEGAFLNTVKFWEESVESSHLDRTSVSLEKGSRLELQSFVESGRMVRSEVTVDLNGERAFASLKGLSVLSGKSEVHQVAVVNHRVPQCESRQLFKNILADEARSEFNSLVYVAKDAQKSDSSQLNKNLLLSDTARAFARPQLRIYADDVKCNHGATVGRLETDELFYLRSRGISTAQARTMITYGFVKELIQVRWLPGLEKRLENSFHSRLEKILEVSGE